MTVGNFNTQALVPKLAIVMLTDLINIPPDLTQETSLNGKYLKGIPTAVTNPDANIGNTDHTHTSDGDHGHVATVASHGHSATHSQGAGVSNVDSVASSNGWPLETHVHSMSGTSFAGAEADNNGDHTHDTISNDLEHRTITFYKKTNTITNMSTKALPQNMTFFYSKTGTLPEGLLENLNYVDKHFKGDPTPGIESGSNTHQHDSQIHDHPTDISAHEHTYTLAPTVGSPGEPNSNIAGRDHSHSEGTATTINKSSTPVNSGDDSGHQHDDISHQPAFKTLRLLQVNSINMSIAGIPKNCILMWLDTITLLNLVTNWQVSDGTNDTIDLLDVYPKGNTIPDTTGGNNEHTHSEDTVSHAHANTSVGHTHGTTGTFSVPSAPGAYEVNGSLFGASATHTHGFSSLTAQAAQTITITNGASNHDHGSISNNPESKTVAFIQRVN